MAFHTASFLWTYGLPEPAELPGSTVLWAWQPLPPQTPLAGAFIQLFPASLGRSYNTAALHITPKASPGLSPRCSHTSPCTGLFQIPWGLHQGNVLTYWFFSASFHKALTIRTSAVRKTQSSLKRLKMSAVSSFKTTKPSWFCFGFIFVSCYLHRLLPLPGEKITQTFSAAAHCSSTTSSLLLSRGSQKNQSNY